MLYYSRWKIALIFVVTLLGVFFSMPNLFSKETVDSMPKWLPFRQMALGLDLRGGSHVLLQLKVDDLKKGWLETIRDDVRETLRKDHIGYANLTSNKDQVRVSIRNPEQIDAAYSKLRAMARPVGGSMFGGSGAYDLDVTKEGEGVITIKPTDAAMRDRVSSAMDAASRNHSPPHGRSGHHRTAHPAPGAGSHRGAGARPQGPSGAQGNHRQDGQAHLPARRYEHVAGRGEGHAGSSGFRPLPRRQRSRRAPSAEDQGDRFRRGSGQRSGQASISQNSEPVVNFRFNTSGAKRFGDVTRENVGKPFAIVLDNKVLSDPVIRTPILDGSGQISGNFTVAETNEFSILLRSGSLPAKLTIVEERTVGPSLGEDSIEAGKKASIVGLIGVAVFMVRLLRPVRTVRQLRPSREHGAGDRRCCRCFSPR